MIRLFISDIDGTLLDQNRHMKNVDRLGLRSLVDSEVDVCLASGRMDSEIRDVLSVLEVPAHRICQNGSFVFTKEGDLVTECFFESPLIISLLGHLENISDVLPVLCTSDKRYIKQRTQIATKVETRLFQPFCMLDNIRYDLNRRVSKVSVYGSSDRLRALETELHRIHGDLLNVFFAEDDCLDLMPESVSKGHGILSLLKATGVKLDEIVCVGDSDNDISMFQLSSHSFAMSKAKFDVQKHATHVIDSVSDAVYWTLEHNNRVQGIM